MTPFISMLTVTAGTRSLSGQCSVARDEPESKAQAQEGQATGRTPVRCGVGYRRASTERRASGAYLPPAPRRWTQPLDLVFRSRRMSYLGPEVFSWRSTDPTTSRPRCCSGGCSIVRIHVWVTAPVLPSDPKTYEAAAISVSRSPDPNKQDAEQSCSVSPSYYREGTRESTSQLPDTADRRLVGRIRWHRTTRILPGRASLIRRERKPGRPGRSPRVGGGGAPGSSPPVEIWAYNSKCAGDRRGTWPLGFLPYVQIGPLTRHKLGRKGPSRPSQTQH